MARKRTPRRDWRMVVFLIISMVIILSMALAYVIPTLPY